MRIAEFVAPHIAASLVIIALAGCQVVPETGGRQPSPAPTPAPTAPAPAPVPAPSQSNDAWEVAPVTSGNWGYESRTGESVASFGASPVAPLVVLRCQKSSRQVSMTLAGSASPRVTLRTSKGVLDWSGATQPMAGTSALVITRPASDPGLDWVAFSRGRVSIEPAGGQRIILPVVSEIGRVVEDCRS
ncbi:hypothetical protein M2333_003336 [Sphingobium sp. B11D3B]|uniref:hypothetical protein n=1 Tax=Sphingobium sp. B11D3B TaxID=2940575 RepID=UPI0022274E3C|nr:hypothetical protein [Sphingobium sp. B11D3B]MCW2390290.1 hypothetical protein [Sphingobium sp. B11D3B]